MNGPEATWDEARLLAAWRDTLAEGPDPRKAASLLGRRLRHGFGTDLPAEARDLAARLACAHALLECLCTAFDGPELKALAPLQPIRRVDRALASCNEGLRIAETDRTRQILHAAGGAAHLLAALTLEHQPSATLENAVLCADPSMAGYALNWGIDPGPHLAAARQTLARAADQREVHVLRAFIALMTAVQRSPLRWQARLAALADVPQPPPPELAAAVAAAASALGAVPAWRRQLQRAAPPPLDQIRSAERIRIVPLLIWPEPFRFSPGFAASER